MALTTAQETKIAEIIAAYEGGVRITDLPPASGVNPYDLYVEVAGADGESKKAALATLLPYVEDQCSYGIEFDTTVSAPECTRIGSAEMHRRLPVQSRMRGCLLNDDGEVTEYLNPTDWNAHDLSGARGQVMVEVPSHYIKFETDGTKRRVRMSEVPLPGYNYVPLMYIGAFPAALQRSANKLASVVNGDTDYRGGSNNAENDNNIRTLLAKPVTNMTPKGMREAARNRGNAGAGGCGWNAYVYDAYKSVFWLFAVEYATLNTQAEYTSSLTADGYRQGGLGPGVTNLLYTDWQAYNGVQPFVPLGVTNYLGNGTGCVNMNMGPDCGTGNVTVSIPRYRGIELPFSQLNYVLDGVYIKSVYSGPTQTLSVYVCHSPADYTDGATDGYTFVGNMATSTGYINEMIFGEEGDILARATGGSSSTYMCDKLSNFTSTESGKTYVLQMGGAANDGAAAGFLYNAMQLQTLTTANSCTRLCFIP